MPDAPCDSIDGVSSAGNGFDTFEDPPLIVASESQNPTPQSELHTLLSLPRGCVPLADPVPDLLYAGRRPRRVTDGQSR